jgi:hypothetical protein
MPRAIDELEELRVVCPEAREMAEGGLEYILLPKLKVPGANAGIDALLCPQGHSGYTTRLFLSSVIGGKGQNWSVHTILSRTWHTCSWNNVPASQRLAEILVQHLRAFR